MAEEDPEFDIWRHSYNDVLKVLQRKRPGYYSKHDLFETWEIHEALSNDL